MSDELKKFLQREHEEIKQNKFRIAAMIGVVVVAIIFWIVDDSSRGEEIDLSTPTAEAPPVTNDLPVKVLNVEKISDGVKIVTGASPDALIVADPFAGRKKSLPPPKVVAPIENIPPIEIQPQPIIQPQQNVQPKPREKIFLTGTAISGNIKTAMILRDKETLFLTIGDEIDGRRIIDITTDAVTFDDGEILTIKN